jgi:hypothetical protein
MKLTKLNSTGFKIVQYYGNTLIVPESTKYIAVDRNGKLNAFPYKPNIDEVLGIWDSHSEYDEIGCIELEYVNWKLTLVEL